MLCVVKVSRNCDNSLCHLLSQICLCICLQLPEESWAEISQEEYFLSSMVTPCSPYPYVSLDGGDGLLCVCDCLTLCRLTHNLPVFVNATTDGVVLTPSVLAITTGFPPSANRHTQLFVVPKSIPINLAHSFFLLINFLYFHSTCHLTCCQALPAGLPTILRHPVPGTGCF